MRISDWSSDVCSSDLVKERRGSTYNGNGDDESNGERAGETARHRLHLALRFPDQPTGTQQRITNDKAEPRPHAEGCQPIPPPASICATSYSDALPPFPDLSPLRPPTSFVLATRVSFILPLSC